MGSSRFVCIMSTLAVLLSLCASTARADAPGNIYVSALQKSGGTAFGASAASLAYTGDARPVKVNCTSFA